MSYFLRVFDPNLQVGHINKGLTFSSSTNECIKAMGLTETKNERYSRISVITLGNVEFVECC